MISFLPDWVEPASSGWASLDALLELPRDSSPNNLVPVFHVLRHALSEPKEKEMRTNVIALISKQTGQILRSEEKETDAVTLKKTYQPYFDWFAQKYPKLRRAIENTGGEDDSQWDQLLRSVNWSSGNPARGQSIFIERGCQNCHGITSSLGPELGGAASRFLTDDLFKAIIYPSRDISPLYLPTVFRMRNGETYFGIISFESADGVIVTTSANTNVRLASSEIVSREPGKVSLMPTGLLNGLQPQALADLHAYLKTLAPASR